MEATALLRSGMLKGSILGFWAQPLHVYSVVARSNDILKQLVLEAKRMYEKDAEHRVHIFMGDTWAL